VSTVNGRRHPRATLDETDARAMARSVLRGVGPFMNARYFLSQSLARRIGALALSVTLLSAALAACSGSTTSAFAGSDAGADATPDGATAVTPTFHKDVEPILQKHCQTCHRAGGIAPMPLMTFADAHPMSAPMRFQTQRGLMPPWDGLSTNECSPPFPWKNDARLSPDEIATIGAWADADAPEGDPKDAPPPVTFAASDLPGMTTQLSPDTPFVAGGDRDEFRCFVLDPKLATTQFVNGTFVVPGNSKVVHHAVIFTDPKRESLPLVGPDGSYECAGGPRVSNSGVLAVWAPGATPIELPSNIGYPITPGTLLVMQIHYHPGGVPTADPDTTRFQMRLSDAKPEYYLVTMAIGNFPSPLASGDGLLPGPNDPASGPLFYIPANVKGHTESMQWTVPSDLKGDVYVYGLMAHMHLVGVDMKIDLLHAGTSDTTCLLQEPRWDFGWQRFYAYDAPIQSLPKLQAGDKIKLRCTYDNTMDNAHLAADLSAQHRAVAPVLLGEETTNEMCVTLPQLLVKAP